MKLLDWMHGKAWKTLGAGHTFGGFKTDDQWKVCTDAQEKDEDPPIIYISEDDSFYHRLLNIGTLGHTGEATDNYLTVTPRPSLNYYIMGKEEKEEAEDNESKANQATKLELNLALEKALVVTGVKPKSKIPVIDGKLLLDYQRRTLLDLFLENDLKGNIISSNNNNYMNKNNNKNRNNKKVLKSNSVGVQSLVKKFLKCHSSCPKHSSAGDDGILDDNGGTSFKEFHKMIKTFHKKIHPDHNNPGRTSSAKNKVAVKNRPTKTSASSPGITLSSSSDSTAKCAESDGNKARWIKTDSEFLVLEL